MNKNEKKNGAAFYIALCCCVAVIGLVGYAGRYVSSQTQSDEMSENVPVQLIPTNAPSLPEQTAEPTSPPVEKTAAPSKTKATRGLTDSVQTMGGQPAKTPEPTPEPVSFTAPCKGSVIKEMSSDELEYNKILGDWRTHNGVDISVSDGESIKAVHSGTVTEVFDGILGRTVIVDCKNGFTAVYGCLAGDDAVTVGQDINAGDVIGTAGGTGSENETQPHLHIELIKDGEHINPTEYISFGE